MQSNRAHGLLMVVFALFLSGLACNIPRDSVDVIDKSLRPDGSQDPESEEMLDELRYKVEDFLYHDDEDSMGAFNEQKSNPDVLSESSSSPSQPGSSSKDGLLKPVGFVNYGTIDAVVRPWTWVPPGSDVRDTPVSASTVSSANDGIGDWPNSSRFLSLPMGTYIWCVDWEEGDIDEDGVIDYSHYFIDEPTTLDDNDSDELEFAEEVSISAPPTAAAIYAGRCGEPPVEESACTGAGIETQAHVVYMADTTNPPDIIAWAAQPGPEGIELSFGSGTTEWGHSRILWVSGDWEQATTSDPYTAIGVQVQGDRTIGWAKVLFDGVEVWQGNTATTWNDGTNNGVYVEVRCFPSGQHTIRIESLGKDGGGGGITIPVSYFGFRQ